MGSTASSVPAANLAADDYLIALAVGSSSSDELASYALRIVR
jgi:hypothetical protein